MKSGYFRSTPKYVNIPLDVILQCLACILCFNVNNDDTAILIKSMYQNGLHAILTDMFYIKLLSF